MFLIFLAGVLWGAIGIFVKELNSLGASSAQTCFLRMFSGFLIMSAGLGTGFCYGMAAIFGKAGEKTDASIISAYSDI